MYYDIPTYMYDITAIQNMTIVFDNFHKCPWSFLLWFELKGISFHCTSSRVYDIATNICIMWSKGCSDHLITTQMRVNLNFGWIWSTTEKSLVRSEGGGGGGGGF